jgi:hypothetical protein
MWNSIVKSRTPPVILSCNPLSTKETEPDQPYRVIAAAGGVHFSSVWTPKLKVHHLDAKPAKTVILTLLLHEASRMAGKMRPGTN